MRGRISLLLGGVLVAALAVWQPAAAATPALSVSTPTTITDLALDEPHHATPA